MTLLYCNGKLCQRAIFATVSPVSAYSGMLHGCIYSVFDMRATIEGQGIYQEHTDLPDICILQEMDWEMLEKGKETGKGIRSTSEVHCQGSWTHCGVHDCELDHPSMHELSECRRVLSNRARH